MKNGWAVLAMVMVFAACGYSPYPGYKRVENGVYLRLVALGDGERLVQPGDCVLVRVRAAQHGADPGSLLSTEAWYLGAHVLRDALQPAVRRMQEGDSMSLITRAERFPWRVVAPHLEAFPHDTTLVQVELSVRQLRTPDQLRAERDRQRRQEPERFEQRLIEAYLQRTSIPLQRWGTSQLHYHITGTALDTTATRRGDVVQIAYNGRRVEDGITVDDSHANGHDLVYRVGDQDQVIEGVAVAVHLLREGQEGTFIVPSSMAFGERGVPGIIDPWTPLVYSVRLVKVERSTGAGS